MSAQDTVTLTVAPDEPRGLIKQTGRERLLTKLNSFKENDLTAKEKNELDEVEKNFIEYFLDLRWRMIGVSRIQMKKLDEEEVRELAGILYEKARPIEFLQKAFTFGVPGVGWLIGGLLYALTDSGDMNTFKSWRYRTLYRKLRKAYGENYSPHKALMARLEENR